MRIHWLTLTLCLLAFTNSQRWSVEKANNWYSQRKWSAGVNYIPAYADN